MMSLSDDKQADIIDDFNTTFIFELQLNKANTSDTEDAFWICICPFLMILFLQKFTINVTILILK